VHLSLDCTKQTVEKTSRRLRIVSLLNQNNCRSLTQRKFRELMDEIYSENSEVEKDQQMNSSSWSPIIEKNMNVPKRKLSRYLKIAAGIAFISIIFIIILVYTLPQPTPSNTLQQSQNLESFFNGKLDVDVDRHAESSFVSLNAKSDSLLFTTHKSPTPYLKIKFPHKLFQVANNPSNLCGEARFKPDGPHDAYSGVRENFPQMCLYFESKLHAAVYDTIVAGMQCHHIYWFTPET
ncbi:hypothetical protein EGW08_005063, partial [Elysia chlorotica]